MVAHAALRAGAGLATIASWEESAAVRPGEGDRGDGRGARARGRSRGEPGPGARRQEGDRRRARIRHGQCRARRGERAPGSVEGPRRVRRRRAHALRGEPRGFRAGRGDRASSPRTPEKPRGSSGRRPRPSRAIASPPSRAARDAGPRRRGAQGGVHADCRARRARRGEPVGVSRAGDGRVGRHARGDRRARCSAASPRSTPRAPAYSFTPRRRRPGAPRTATAGSSPRRSPTGSPTSSARCPGNTRAVRADTPRWPGFRGDRAFPRGSRYRRAGTSVAPSTCRTASPRCLRARSTQESAHVERSPPRALPAPRSSPTTSSRSARARRPRPRSARTRAPTRGRPRRRRRPRAGHGRARAPLRRRSTSAARTCARGRSRSSSASSSRATAGHAASGTRCGTSPPTRARGRSPSRSPPRTPTSRSPAQRASGSTLCRRASAR